MTFGPQNMAFGPKYERWSQYKTYVPKTTCGPNMTSNHHNMTFGPKDDIYPKYDIWTQNGLE